MFSTEKTNNITFSFNKNNNKILSIPTNNNRYYYKGHIIIKMLL